MEREGCPADMAREGKSRRVLIAGCGDVGGALGTLLREDGHAVWGLRRNPRDLPAGIEPLAADLTRPESLGVIPREIDAVFYTAAASGPGKEEYRAAYVTGLRNILATIDDYSAVRELVVDLISEGVAGTSASL